MFTGIVEEVGRIQSRSAAGGGDRLEIEAGNLARELDTGQSVSVDGVCLTVEAVLDRGFRVFLSTETLERSTLGERTEGARVNLERALPAAGRFDGHLVQGHVDATTELLAAEDLGEDRWLTFALPRQQAPYIVEKGSVALDGISLTVAERTDETFSVAIIPETDDRTALPNRNPGDPVNLEVDIVAKYVESLVDGYFDRQSSR